MHHSSAGDKEGAAHLADAMPQPSVQVLWQSCDISSFTLACTPPQRLQSRRGPDPQRHTLQATYTSQIYIAVPGLQSKLQNQLFKRVDLAYR